jgi:hypothetical protein
MQSKPQHQIVKTFYNKPRSEPLRNPIPQQRYIRSDPTKPLQINVENAINRFKPSRRWKYEREYHDELYNWLSRKFQVEYEVQMGFVRSDLVTRQKNTFSTNSMPQD